jgi:F-type H+-transporting ATPase subunit b
MPQLEFATYASQIFWLAVIFLMLYIFLSKKSLPAVMEVLHNRESRISGDITRAENMRAEAEAAQLDLTTSLLEARQKSANLLHEAKDKIIEEEAARSAKLEKHFASQSKDSENKMAALREESIGKIVPIAAQAASMMLEKLIGEKIENKKLEQIALKISGSL